MCEFSDLLLADCDENVSGTTSEAWVIPNHNLDTRAATFKEDGTKFNDRTAYALNDLVSYKGQVYECTTIHSAGAWDANNFTLIENGNVRINGTHVPAATKGFSNVFINDEDSNYKHETLGKRFNRSGKNTFTFYHPGNSIEAAEFAHQAKIAGGVTALIPLEDGRILQIGGKYSQAEITASYESGTKENPDSRWMFEVTSYATSLCYYESSIPVA